MEHKKGASAEVLLYGATVISWKAGGKSASAPTERLFVSNKAALDGSKPVRGGIPVVFPCFGPPSHPQHLKLPQHGFARSEMWKFDKVLSDNEEVSVQLSLEPNANIIAKYDKPFRLAYIVKLSDSQFTTELHVTNTSETESLEFQALFHNYIRGPSDDVLIFPLQNVQYYDKTVSSEVEKNTPKTETRNGVDVRSYTDAVYEDAPQKYEVKWPKTGLELRVSALKDLVVWNPQKEVGSKIADMEDGGWERYVCVEPGFVRGFATANPGSTWIGQQVLTVIDVSSSL